MCRICDFSRWKFKLVECKILFFLDIFFSKQWSTQFKFKNKIQIINNSYYRLFTDRTPIQHLYTTLNGVAKFCIISVGRGRSIFALCGGYSIYIASAANDIILPTSPATHPAQSIAALQSYLYILQTCENNTVIESCELCGILRGTKIVYKTYYQYNLMVYILIDYNMEVFWLFKVCGNLHILSI